jgi:hypothetical protein
MRWARPTVGHLARCIGADDWQDIGTFPQAMPVHRLTYHADRGRFSTSPLHAPAPTAPHMPSGDFIVRYTVARPVARARAPTFSGVMRRCACPGCDVPLDDADGRRAMRPDAIYCSPRCRIRASRIRRGLVTQSDELLAGARASAALWKGLGQRPRRRPQRRTS